MISFFNYTPILNIFSNYYIIKFSLVIAIRGISALSKCSHGVPISDIYFTWCFF